MAAMIFARLKQAGIKTELVGEYAKEAVLQQDYTVLCDQLWLFANQAHRLRGMARSGVCVAVCDSPLLLSLLYGRKRATDNDNIFEQMVLREYRDYDNLDYIITREPAFWEQCGRADDRQFALDIDKAVHDLFALEKVNDYKTVTPYQAEEVTKQVLEYCKQQQAMTERI